jgi:hypothetical protein
MTMRLATGIGKQALAAWMDPIIRPTSISKQPERGSVSALPEDARPLRPFCSGTEIP